MKPYIQETLSDDKGSVVSAQRIPPKSEGSGGGVTADAVLTALESMDSEQQSDARAAIGATDALTSIPDDVKAAILNCFSHVAWDDEHGQDYYDELSADLYLGPLEGISAVFEQGANAIYDTDSLDVLRQYLTVTADYTVAGEVEVTGYTLSGTLEVGTSTITVSYGGQTATFTVTVSTHVLYSLENQAFNNDQINTGVNVVATDISYSIAFDATITSEPTSGTGSSARYVAVLNADSSGYSLTIGKGSSTMSQYTVGYMGTTLPSDGRLSASGTGRLRFVLRHTSGSGSVYCKMRKDLNAAVAGTITATFAASNNSVKFGQGSASTTSLPVGTINKAVIYDYAMSDAEINAFLGL